MMPLSPARDARSWFRSDHGRRYGRDIAIIVVLKLVLLIALYVFFVAPQPRADTSPDATRQHLLDNPPNSDDRH